MAMTEQESKIINLCGRGRKFDTSFFDISSGEIIIKSATITGGKLVNATVGSTQLSTSVVDNSTVTGGAGAALAVKSGSISPTYASTALKTKGESLFFNGCTSTALTTNATFGQSFVLPAQSTISAAYFVPTATIAAGTATDNLSIILLKNGAAVAGAALNATGTATVNAAKSLTVTTTTATAADVLTLQYQKVGNGPAADPVAGSLSITFAPV